MGFDYSYYLLPMSVLNKFRETCIRSYGMQQCISKLYEVQKYQGNADEMKEVVERFMNADVAQDCSGKDVWEVLQMNKLFYVSAPRPWSDDISYSECYGDESGSYYISKRQHILNKIRKAEPEWNSSINNQQDSTNSQDSLFESNNLYKKIIHLMDFSSQDSVLIVSTSF